MALTDKEIDNIIESVKATLSFEGLKISEFAENINRMMLNGEITGEEARDIITKSHGID